MSNKGKAHMGRVAQLPCCLCGTHGVQVHHIREGGAAGAGEKANDWLTLPVCPSCHTGTHGIHGNKSMLKLSGKSEHEHLGETLERLYGGLR
ncbi:DUF968 domain-containing protein [Aromatoleum anaerobium]|uniref:DUF968 domain-containing protein n=1 Tax=Aromatoleum anaerobium TaxID=182180 RepID=A0ABX1PSY3_9RHOO|nr:DUF968 domain-containing protein [Aromatoleum anaerobium]MCK0507934.1 DUF968 domain-containing protein [Aromatoleum anaerobium]